ncbi:hypothetical protein BH09CHL1_BH09CHL1_04090 [soil metagenome]
MASTYHSVTSKGQVTIPAHIRDSLGIKQGDKVGFVQRGNEVLLVRPIDVVNETAGVFKKYADALDRVYTAEELRDFYEEGVAQEVYESMQESE